MTRKDLAKLADVVHNVRDVGAAIRAARCHPRHGRCAVLDEDARRRGAGVLGQPDPRAADVILKGGGGWC
jgi:hypothetical protein